MDDKCTIYRISDIIGKRWTLLILLELFKGGGGRKRFSEIRSSMRAITPKILSERLRELEREGMVKRIVDASSFPVKSEYLLTESGKDFMNIIGDMKKWALHWKIRNKECENGDCSRCML